MLSIQQTTPNRIGLDWVGLDWVGLDWVGLGIHLQPLSDASFCCIMTQK